ncbi:unnamed protein product [Clavelina lepadiformis]|uniref:BTB domain-containing protein n=1 Tax=Clavelina lepadiformis TaxID=159417 RepID=A0ABP0GBR6_CLALP
MGLFRIGNNDNCILSQPQDEDPEVNDAITIRCGEDEEIVCSRSGLAKVSDYFRACLFGNFREKNDDYISLPYVAGDLFVTLLQFYPESIHLTESNKTSIDNKLIEDVNQAWTLIEIADMLYLEHAAQKCDDFIIGQVTPQNCVEICHLADTFHRSNILLEVVRKIALFRFGKGVENLLDFRHLFCNNHLHDDKNIKGNEENKANSPDNINEEDLQTIFNLLNQYKFTHKIFVIGGYNFHEKGENSTQNECFSIDVDAFNTDVTKGVSSSSEVDNESVEDTALLSDYGYSQQGAENDSRDIVSFTINEKSQYKQIDSFPEKLLEDYRTVLVDTFIYVIGGIYYEQNLPTNATWRYDTRRNEWRTVAPLKHPRMEHCATTVKEIIYVCGGYDGNAVHKTTESFNPAKNSWLAQPDMPIGVGNAACTSDDVNLYVICGQFGNKKIHTTRKIQQFNTVTQQWSLPAEYASPVFYPHSEYGMSCAVLEDEIVIFGGQTIRVDAYNIKTKQWRRLKDMEHRRIDASAITFRNIILVAGGYDYTTGEFFNTMEIYNKDKELWTLGKTLLPQSAKNLGFCYVFDVVPLDLH